MENSRKRLLDSNILLHKEHNGCKFWESPDGRVLVVFNPSVGDLVKQAEKILEFEYELSGGIQLIRRDDGSFNASATFLLTGKT